MLLLPPQLISLLEGHLDSFEKLEVARLVRAQASVSRRSLRDALLTHGDAVEDAITALARAAFLDIADEVVRLGPRATRDGRFEKLMDLYEQDPYAVMSALSTIALRRIREGAARMLELSGKKDGDHRE